MAAELSRVKAIISKNRIEKKGHRRVDKQTNAEAGLRPSSERKQERKGLVDTMDAKVVPDPRSNISLEGADLIPRGRLGLRRGKQWLHIIRPLRINKNKKKLTSDQTYGQ